jgi:hypothetical protein
MRSLDLATLSEAKCLMLHTKFTEADRHHDDFCGSFATALTENEISALKDLNPWSGAPYSVWIFNSLLYSHKMVKKTKDANDVPQQRVPNMTAQESVFRLKQCAVLFASVILLLTTAESQELRHYVFYGLQRERITEPAFIETPALAGAQLKYRWSELELRRGEYDFTAIRHDLEILTRLGKRLFIQLQDVSFVEAHPNVPEYLREDPEFHGGVAAGYDHPDGDESRIQFSTWNARRWDPAVRARMVALVRALAAEFDGKIAGINFAETSVDGGTADHPWEDYTSALYYEAMCDLMRQSRGAFKTSDILIYANFMPGESLPDEDKGYLKGIYRLADSLGFGVGGPDLLPNRRYQRKHSLPLIAARAHGTVAGVAVQDGNLADLDRRTGKRVTVDSLAAYALDPLHLDYLFWGTEEPYWSKEVVPYLKSLKQ